ncbi:MAG TPA: tetratricopeptide repeat protein [Candidatus Acidoferrum sp.]
MRLLRNFTALLWAVFCIATPASSQTKPSANDAVELGRNALRQQNYAEAIRILEAARVENPSDRNLKLELGRAYLYSRQDDRAIRLFRDVLRDDPSNRTAKLELARALSYKRNFKDSDQLYRDLLVADANDEAASIGLVRNLIHEKRFEDARSACSAGLAHHPDSKRLRDFQQIVEVKSSARTGTQPANAEPNAAARHQGGEAQGNTAYFSDSAGNRSWRSTQGFDHQIIRGLTTRFRVEERSLWLVGGPKANVLWGTDQVRLQLMPSFALSGTGGLVRFADGSNSVLYRAEAELHPARRLWLEGGFLRRPISPTYDSTQFNLTAEGWRAKAEWYPKGWQFDASWSGEHYSDSNRSQRFETEFLRWFGTSHFSVGAGYRLNYVAFDQSLLHGYFNPSKYYSHLGRAGLKFRLGRAFRAEYLGGAGAESISAAPYQNAWELLLRNRMKFESWEFGGDYFYFRLAQSTGAFNSQGGRLALAYYF